MTAANAGAKEIFGFMKCPPPKPGTTGVRAKDRHATAGDLSEARRRKLAADALKQTPQLHISIMRNTGRRRLDLTPDLLGPTRTRVWVIVSRPIRLREGAAPIRRVLIFDDHPATIRLLDEIDRAQKRENKLALVQFSALILLLMLVMFWRLL